jgi:arylsulfatase A-like enzyme
MLNLTIKSPLKELAIFAAVFACLTAQTAVAQNKLDSNKPNIIFILADDLGWRDVSFNGNTYLETPNIDKLSTEGIVFKTAYTNAPNCAPTRACLMSGQYGPRHGIYTVANSDRGSSVNRKLIPIKNNTILPSSIVTLPEVLKSGGYTTGLFGKWHLGNSAGTRPEDQGFDVNIGGNLAGAPKTYFSPYGNPNIKDGPVGEELTDRLANEAITFIKENKKKPFFVYLPFYAVHTPIEAKPELTEKYKTKKHSEERSNPKYAAMVENMDQNVGKVLAAVEQLGLTENTIVVFYADNGTYFPVSSAAPLRESKGSLYEGGVRVPLVVKWPGKIKAGSSSNEPVIGMDFYPTFLSITGISKPKQILDGIDISPALFKNDKLNREKLFWHFPAYLEKFPGMTKIWRETPGSTIRKGDWKLIQRFEDNSIELYNLKEDIGEKRNLLTSNPEKAKELLSDLNTWRKELNAPIPTELNPEYKIQTLNP